jgi:hypothetical protein
MRRDKTLISVLWHAERWRDRWGVLRSTLWHVPIMRLDNRWQDLRAVLAGACNRSTWNGCGYNGGYPHWRCGKARGHQGEHRFNNYVWDGPGSRTRYDPIPIRNADNTDWFYARSVTPFMKLASGRRAVGRRSRSRLLARQYAARKATR